MNACCSLSAKCNRKAKKNEISMPVCQLTNKQSLLREKYAFFFETKRDTVRRRSNVKKEEVASSDKTAEVCQRKMLSAMAK
jgi:hypothetical protein